METVTSLLVIFAFLFAGMAGARFKIIPKTGYLDRIMSIALALLLFSMGLRIGMLDSITQQLMRIGLLSVSFAVSTVLGTVVLLFGLILVTGKLRTVGLNKRDQASHSGAGFGSADEAVSSEVVGLSEPLRLFGLVVLGFLSGYFLPFFGWFQEKYTTYL